MDLQLGGKRAFISGSSQGIGFAIAKGLAAEGVEVVLNGRTREKLSAAVEQLGSEVPGASVSAIAADFDKPEQVDRLCAELGEVDMLINNVGLFGLKAFADISDDEWRQYFEVNVQSGVRLARQIMPGMLERGWGRIIFVGSESGVNVPSDMIHYGASKAAMLAVGNGLAKLTRGTGVTVNSVLGGPTYSDGVAQTVETLARQSGVPAAELKQQIIAGNKTTLLERFIEPAEIANMVVFLASPAASASNGAAVRVDGGVLTATL
ncbi:NAD(P)-dependent dehydrogenase (short-subunit alcohol dehydrogenase family) [Arthrobacter silviterrae]|uniref:SDR family oxidoreductase n=1 Tax=Arthrobacter silviterrae TaxID=2026658 RepID=A0ABX0D5B9_9MICC|nr:SDR family oxidoreductase [Arthrobacter silviterrae]MDQ0279441.1 NAD(P)-dependent dehydrogenase (short-subunit alcohol dehydrogenase family) [Arthrobacter silviterrae]NGN82079.1 SDR family oxidoreductase [Arthrobacter silviterrae]